MSSVQDPALKVELKFLARLNTGSSKYLKRLSHDSNYYSNSDIIGSFTIYLLETLSLDFKETVQRSHPPLLPAKFSTAYAELSIGKIRLFLPMIGDLPCSQGSVNSESQCEN
jgi:hypothetical protein